MQDTAQQIIGLDEGRDVEPRRYLYGVFSILFGTVNGIVEVPASLANIDIGCLIPYSCLVKLTIPVEDAVYSLVAAAGHVAVGQYGEYGESLVMACTVSSQLSAKINGLFHGGYSFHCLVAKHVANQRVVHLCQKAAFVQVECRRDAFLSLRTQNGLSGYLIVCTFLDGALNICTWPLHIAKHVWITT